MSARVDRQLTAWRDPDHDVHVAVSTWIVTEPVSDQYVEREPSVRMVWNYLLRLGPSEVWRKIRSRMAESRRNERIAGVGVGIVLAAPDRSGLAAGARALFFAPSHSRRWTILSLDARLVCPAPAVSARTDPSTARLPEGLRSLAGWTRASGNPIDSATVARLLHSVGAPDSTSTAPTVGTANVTERVTHPRAPTDRPTAVVFGLGNYAKTQVIPVVRRFLDLRTVHEVDPDQLTWGAPRGVTADTSPIARSDERYDAWFVAGFHHTHAALATSALRQGAYAVVEKPLATAPDQLAELRSALAAAGRSRLFGCFHRRYSRLTQWALEDLGTAAPIDMHCMVYEIPLPRLHWYNWPASGSRLVSNGCHWIDLFLHVNAGATCVERDVGLLRGRDAWVRLALSNGAQFTMSLTDAGSERLGVRDLVELRSGRASARLVDAAEYQSEDRHRILRRRRSNPADAYRRMYRSICERIVAGADGDPPSALESSEVVLALEAELRRARPATT